MFCLIFMKFCLTIHYLIIKNQTLFFALDTFFSFFIERIFRDSSFISHVPANLSKSIMFPKNLSQTRTRNHFSFLTSEGYFSQLANQFSFAVLNVQAQSPLDRTRLLRGKIAPSGVKVYYYITP